MTQALNIYKHIYSGEKRLLGDPPEGLNWLRITDNKPVEKQTHEQRAARFQAQFGHDPKESLKRKSPAPIAKSTSTRTTVVHETGYEPVAVYHDDVMETVMAAALTAEIISSYDSSLSYDSGASYDSGSSCYDSGSLSYDSGSCSYDGGGSFGGGGSDGSW